MMVGLVAILLSHVDSNFAITGIVEFQFEIGADCVSNRGIFF